MAKPSTSSAHTAGPWHTDWLGDERGWILDQQSNYIAEIVTEDECGFVCPKRQQKANACLIAAAPELLKACLDALDVLCGFDAEMFDDEENREISELLRAVGPVLRRAQGHD